MRFYQPPATSTSKKAAGCMIMARRTGRFLMCKRSGNTPYPLTWASFGGKQEGFESAEQTARREAFEETGHKIEGPVEHLFHFELSTFSFDTFIATVDDEFAPRLNDESEDATWMTLEEIPENMHDGLRAILEDKMTVNRLIKHVESTSGRRCDFDRIYRKT